MMKNKKVGKTSSRKMKVFASLVYVIIMLISSCTGLNDFDDEYYAESVEDVAIEQDQSYSTIELGITTYSVEEIKTPEEPEQEIYRMEMNPIEVFEKYCVTDGMKVYGLDGKTSPAVVFTDTDDNAYTPKKFYKDDSGIYFSVSVMEKGDEIPETDPVQYEAIEKEYMFKQVSGVVSEITEFPEIPESECVGMELNDDGFKIVTTDYKGTACSYVYTGTTPTAFIMVDGFMSVENGLWWSVPTDYSIRLKGLYYQAAGGKVNRILDSGRIF